MDNNTQIDVMKFDKILAAFERTVFASDPIHAREQACFVAAGLFPSFTDDPTNDEALSDYSLEKYGYYRSLGLSVADSAYSLEMSAGRLIGFLNGVGLSLERFVELIKQELFSRAECKARLLKDIEQSTGTKNWRTSLTLLEKLYPETYSPKAPLEEKVDKLIEDVWKINVVEGAPTTKEKE